MSRGRTPRPGTVVNYEVTGNGTPDSPAAIEFSIYSGRDPGIAAISAALPDGTRIEARQHAGSVDYKFFATNTGTTRNEMLLLWLELADRINWRFGRVR